MDIPKKVEFIIQTLIEHGFEAYAVGGCVRDSLLGKEPEDWDITTSAKPEEVKQLFRRTIDTGIAHGTVTVMLEKQGFEVTTYRIDGEYEDGRHPKQVEFTSKLEEDLKRRDFTINAMAFNKQTGIVDLFQGQEDMKRHMIRCVGEPIERFSEDALRMLRAIRFAGQLQFSIEEKTKKAIKEKAAALEQVSAERIRVELEKLLLSNQPEQLLTAYEIGITAIILPEFDKMIQTEQNNPHHIYNVGIHSIVSIQKMNELCKRLNINKKTHSILVFTMLLHDVGKPIKRTIGEDGYDHFYGHPKESALFAKDILKRLKFDNETIDIATRLIFWHDYRFMPKKSMIRRGVHKVGEDIIELLFLVQRADAMAQNPDTISEKIGMLEKVEFLYKEVKEKRECLNLKNLSVNGRDLIKEGFPAGKEMGKLLNYLLEQVLEHPEWNEYDKLIELAKDFIS